MSQPSRSPVGPRCATAGSCSTAGRRRAWSRPSLSTPRRWLIAAHRRRTCCRGSGTGTTSKSTGRWRTPTPSSTCSATTGRGRSACSASRASWSVECRRSPMRSLGAAPTRASSTRGGPCAFRRSLELTADPPVTDEPWEPDQQAPARTVTLCALVDRRARPRRVEQRDPPAPRRARRRRHGDRRAHDRGGVAPARRCKRRGRLGPRRDHAAGRTHGIARRAGDGVRGGLGQHGR